jgi:hypothetical protein
MGKATSGIKKQKRSSVCITTRIEETEKGIPAHKGNIRKLNTKVEDLRACGVEDSGSRASGTSDIL